MAGTIRRPVSSRRDLVSHSGPVAKGSFLQTFVLTDIATGSTECAPLLVREQRLLTEVLSEIRKLLPFALLGLDTDNDSVFIGSGTGAAHQGRDGWHGGRLMRGAGG